MDAAGAIRDSMGPKFDPAATDGALALKELALPPDAAILDVGTGSGNFAIYLASEGYRVLTGEPATDRSRYAGREWARRAAEAGLADRIRFESFDASRLPFDAEAFDAVFFFGVLHHIEEDLRTAVLAEALRVAKPGGAIVFFEPRPQLVERLRLEDPDHPPAANPSHYLPAAASAVRAGRIQGSFMDIYLYRKDSGERIAAV